MPSTTIVRGNILSSIIIGPSLTPVSVAAATTAEQTFTIAGVQLTDFVSIAANIAQTAGIGIANVRVSAPNVIAVAFENTTAGPLVPAAGQYVINLDRVESLPLPVNAA